MDESQWQWISDLRVQVTRLEGKIDSLVGLPERVAKLETAHARLLGWAAGVSAAVTLAMAGIGWAVQAL